METNWRRYKLTEVVGSFTNWIQVNLSPDIWADNKTNPIKSKISSEVVCTSSRAEGVCEHVKQEVDEEFPVLYDISTASPGAETVRACGKPDVYGAPHVTEDTECIEISDDPRGHVNTSQSTQHEEENMMSNQEDSSLITVHVSTVIPNEQEHGLDSSMFHSVQGNRKPHRCAYCSKSFPFKSMLSRHMRTHTGEKPFKCELCGRYFSERCNMIKHMRTHRREKPYTYNQCGRRFTDKSNMDKYVNVHLEEQTYLHERCEECFCYHCDLSRYLKRYTIGRPYTCVYCGNCYSRSTCSRRQGGEKPFQCEFCSKYFTRKYDRKRHMYTHIEGQPFTWENYG